MPELYELVVEAVCRIPIDYAQLRTFSAVEVVRRSGFERWRDEVTLDRMAECLAEHPDWVDAWFQWSEDTRSSPAWYILEREPGVFEVARYDGAATAPTVTFHDRVRACAVYAHHSVEAIAGHAPEASY